MAAQREWFEKDYYAVLGVAEGVSDKELARAYKKLAKQFHPDANQGNKDAEDRFKEISAAYDVLGDSGRRKEYDEVRKMVASGMGPSGAGYGPGGPGGFGGGQTFRFETDGEGGFFSDLLGGMFGGGAGGRRRGGRGGPAGPQRGQDLETELYLAFDDAVHGITQRFASAPTRCVTPATATVPRPGRCPRTVRSATARARSRWTRVRSRSRRCARRAVAAARSSRVRARPVTVGVWRCATAT